jgi:hypothetical protein
MAMCWKKDNGGVLRRMFTKYVKICTSTALKIFIIQELARLR